MHLVGPYLQLGSNHDATIHMKNILESILLPFNNKSPCAINIKDRSINLLSLHPFICESCCYFVGFFFSLITSVVYSWHTAEQKILSVHQDTRPQLNLHQKQHLRIGLFDNWRDFLICSSGDNICVHLFVNSALSSAIKHTSSDL